MAKQSPTREAILRLAAYVGLRLDNANVRNTDRPLYDGEMLSIGGLDDSDLLHEIAHFIVSPVELKHEPNFGLGTGFIGAYTKCSVKLKVDSEEIELRASALGIAFEKAFWMPWQDTMNSHNWLFIDLKSMWRSLCREGHLETDLTPKLLKRIKE